MYSLTLLKLPSLTVGLLTRWAEGIDNSATTLAQAYLRERAKDPVVCKSEIGNTLWKT